MNNTRRSPHRIALAAAAVAALGSALAVGGCGNKQGGAGGDKAANAQPPATPVDVLPVSTGAIAQTIAVVGNLQTLYSVNLSPKTAGKLVNVFVREGDSVHAGQVVAQIDPTTAQQSVLQDQANVQNLQAKLDQAQAQYRQSITNTQVAIQNARAALASAQSTLQKTITGGQPQQKQQAKDQLLQQQANYQNALTAYNREQELYKQGAVAKADLDNAETTYNVQKALLDSYQQNLNLTMQGGRPEDVQVAQQTVQQDQQNLRNAIANRANIDVALQGVQASKAQVAQGEAQLRSARQDLADTNIVSPVNGVVSQRSADPGQIGSPGTTVIQVVDLSTMYYEPAVSETDFRHIAPSQGVAIAVDAFPGRTFYGKVTNIYPSASTTNRQFTIRVSIPNTTRELRPGMYARGDITTVRHTDVVVVPVAALLPREQAAGFAANNSSTGLATGGASLPPQKVFVVGSDGKAAERDVTLGIISGSNAEIVAGLKPGDPLIVKGQGQIQAGDPVAVNARRRTAGAAASPNSPA